MIEVHNLTKAYGDRKAIDQLNFKVAKGEVVGFLGPNGAGKTTTMKILTGFMAPTSGDVKIAGFDVFEDPFEVKKRIGYLPETPPVYLEMVVHDYLDYVARLKGVEKTNVARLVERAIDKTLLGEVKSRIIGNLSKGFRQRVGLAGAIVSDPEILVLDEPTVGLDPRQVGEIRKLLNELKGDHTVILSTHILPEVQATCERAIIINSGKIVAEDTLAGLSSRVKRGGYITIKVRRNSSELASSLKSVQGITAVDVSGNQLKVHGANSEDLIEQVTELAVNKKSGLVEVTHPEAALDDIFIELTTRH